MLLGNFNVFNKNPGRAVGGPPDSTLWLKAGTTMQFYMQDCVVNCTKYSSFNNGAIPPYSWILAPKGGGIASNNTIQGSGIINTTSKMAGGKNATAPLAGEGLIVSPFMQLVVGMVGVLDGVGVLTGTLAGSANMVGALAGQGNLSGALGALAWITATLLGEGTADSDLTAYGHLYADIYVNSGTASTKELAAEVWNSLAAEFDNSGTMGEKLNAAGTAGDPWTTDLDSYNTEGTAGKIMKDGLTEDNFLALK